MTASEGTTDDTQDESTADQRAARDAIEDYYDTILDVACPTVLAFEYEIPVDVLHEELEAMAESGRVRREWDDFEFEEEVEYPLYIDQRQRQAPT